jgi:hypothetical protein
MNEFTTNFFSNTTAEDQENYFTGEVQIPRSMFAGSTAQFPSGVYRIIDGKLYQIQSGMLPEEVRHSLDLITNK